MSEAVTPVARAPAPRTGPPPARILYVEGNRDGTVGGSHRILYGLVRHLDADRYVPVVLFYQDNPYVGRLEAEGIEVHVREDLCEVEDTIRLHGSRLAKLADFGRAVLRRRDLLRRLGIDMLHLNNSIAQGNDDWLPAAWLERMPCLVTVMGDAEPRLDPIHRWLACRFTRIICISRYLHDSLRRYGCPPDRLVLVRAGLDLSALRAAPRRPRGQVRAALGLPEDRIVAAMVGNIRKWKGQHVVVEALARLGPAEREALHVLFIGDVGPAARDYADRLYAAVAGAGLDDRVHFLGHRDDVPDLLAAADIAIHASIDPEPLGLVVLEAMEAGLPVVAADQGGPGEVVTDGTGIRYRMGDADALAGALRRLIADPEARRRMGEAARERVREFDAASFAEGVQRVYAGLTRGA